MTFWIKRRFRVIAPEEINAFQWIPSRGGWVKLPTTGVRTHVIEIYRERQKLFERVREKRQAPTAVLERLGTFQEPALVLGAWERIKSYIVWYSGDNYNTRREIAIFFWISPEEQITEEKAEDWLNTAIKQIFGLGDSFTGVMGWYGAIFTPFASTGQVDDTKPLDSKIIRWEYSKRKQVLRFGEIYR